MTIARTLPFDGALLSEPFRKTLKLAGVTARLSPNGLVTTEHLLRALLKDPDALTIFVSNGVEVGKLSLELMTRRFEQDTGSPPTAIVDIENSEELNRLLVMAARIAQELHQEHIDGGIVIVAMISDRQSGCAHLLLRYGLTFEEAVLTLKHKRERSSASKEADPLAPEASDVPEQAGSEEAASPDTDAADKEEPADLSDLLDIWRPPEAGSRGGIGAAGERRRIPGVGGGGAPRRTPGFGAGERGYGGSSFPPLGVGASERIGSSGRHLEPIYDILETEDAGPAPDQEEAPADQTEPDVGVGKLVENIPRSMRAFVAEAVEVRIAREDSEDLRRGLTGAGEVQDHEVYVTEAMTVQLRAPRGGFTIESGAPETQWINNRLGITDQGGFGAWRWTVTPTKTGQHNLQLVVSARTVNAAGIVAESPLPDQIIEVKVNINYSVQLKKIVGWAAAAIGGGFLARYGETALDWLLPRF